MVSFGQRIEDSNKRPLRGNTRLWSPVWTGQVKRSRMWLWEKVSEDKISKFLIVERQKSRIWSIFGSTFENGEISETMLNKRMVVILWMTMKHCIGVATKCQFHGTLFICCTHLNVWIEQNVSISVFARDAAVGKQRKCQACHQRWKLSASFDSF